MFHRIHCKLYHTKILENKTEATRKDKHRKKLFGSQRSLHTAINRNQPGNTGERIVANPCAIRHRLAMSPVWWTFS